jgi:hypothetical protein
MRNSQPAYKEMEWMDGQLALVEMVAPLSPDRWIRAVMMSR